MPKRSVKFSLGDVVQLNKFWDNRIGIVVAVIRDHYSIANCICEASDVVRVVIKGAIPKKYLKYV
jgi:hypothetical protein